MKLKDKLRQIIPPLWLYKKNYFFAKRMNVKVPDGNNVYIFLAANYGNLGDIAITYAQHVFLEHYYPLYNIFEIPANSSFGYLKGVINKIKKDDIITFVGGGNMGNMYPLYENIRQLVVLLCPNNLIIQFPLSVDFSNVEYGDNILRSARRIYKKAQNFHIMAREKKSSDFLFHLLNKKIPTVPDIVLTLDCFLESSNNRKGVLLCFRNDKEKLIDDKVILSIRKSLKIIFNESVVNSVDTTISDSYVTIDNKNIILKSFLNKISQSQLIITDRLHGMIFAYITGTPAIVFSNSNHKVKYCYEWIKNCGYIKYIDLYTEESFIEHVNNLINVLPNKTKFEEQRILFINKIKKIMP